ncbi:hypothetical protein CFHF_08210 [Caulobacter flavus]|uniref:DUF4149 domain-containing protein n=1 Tax=Caulobacter flavus TaxID=1679497 RepID=A0A2N5CVG1_9CAUL|nr:hypothetical protein [Caulobacter flavus]AYV46890.1 hypothetical protein C1707_11795 [Caulobacter flavus]PLR17798.1 hypothetical protein CFHF_08210 [Caulobacter flavus]
MTGNTPFEFFKLVFPCVGALWLFYGVTLLGLLKQLQDPASLLRWPWSARLGVFTAVTLFLVINLIALIGAQSLMLEAADAAQLSLMKDYRDGLGWLIVLHATVDVGVALVTAVVLGVFPKRPAAIAAT